MFITLLKTSLIPAQEIVINEILASNSSSNQDPDYQNYADWIEIYNAGNEMLELGGYYLTDNFEDTTKWIIPDDAIIAANGFILFWADGRDETLNGYHTNFKLQKKGEEIAIYSPSGTLIDSLSYQSQHTDISFGRQPDGSSSWYFLSTPTANTSNISPIFFKAPPPNFSLAAGYYTEKQTLEITVNSPGTVIRYTLDGNEPTEASPVYSGPLEIRSRQGDPNIFSLIRTNADPLPWLPDWVPPTGEIFKATVVRARTFKTGYQPGDIVTRTYFVDENIHTRYPTIAVISIVSDYKHLFDNTTGIYVPGNTHRSGNSESGNYFQPWEKPAHIEFFEPGGVMGFFQNVGISIQGGTSPASPQKGLHVIARSRYGKSKIKHPIFKNSKSKAKELTEFKRFMIRSWGSTINAALFNDAFAHRLAAELDLDIQEYRPAVVFLNGEYWGIQEVRETNKSSWYYQYHYRIDRENPGIDLLQHSKSNNAPYAYVDEGSTDHWNEMINFINTHDMSLSDNYEYIKTKMDVENFITYLGHCIYVGKWDWPNNNDASWRPATPDGKWRWIQFDMETGFGVATSLGSEYAMLGVQHNMIKHVFEGMPIPDFGTYGPHTLAPRLIHNEEFKNSFINWFVEHLDSDFSVNTVLAILEEMKTELAPYFTEYRQRWPFVTEMNNDWEFQLNKMREYIKARPDYLKQHLVERFGTISEFPPVNNNSIPNNITLFQNYPNPFNSGTDIRFYTHNPSAVSLKIFDINGRIVRVISKNKIWTSGSHQIAWDGNNEHGNAVSSGQYFCKLEFEGISEVKKMVLLK